MACNSPRLVLMAQQVGGKAARDGLFLTHYGPHALPGMVAGAAGFSVLLSLVNGALLRRFVPRVVIPWALVVSGALQVAEWRLLEGNPGVASIVIYLHMAGVGLVLLSTFWSMLNEEFDPHRGKEEVRTDCSRRHIGRTGRRPRRREDGGMVGRAALMLVLAGLHLGCGGFLAWLMPSATAARAAGRVDPRTPRPAPHRSALLQTLGAIVLLGSLGAALLDYVFKLYATAGLGRGSELVRFFALFYAVVAVSSFVLQSVAAKRILEKFGLGKTIRSLPATLAGGSFLTLVAPGLTLVVLARAAEAAVRGSLFRAGYETAYTPVPAAEKRLAKTFIDVVSERGGDALGGAVVYICVHWRRAIEHSGSSASRRSWGSGRSSFAARWTGVYLKTLARSLESQAVSVNLGSDLDLTTRSLVVRAPTMRAGATELWKAPAGSAGGEDSLLTGWPPAVLGPADRPLRSSRRRRLRSGLWLRRSVSFYATTSTRRWLIRCLPAPRRMSWGYFQILCSIPRRMWRCGAGFLGSSAPFPESARRRRYWKGSKTAVSKSACSARALWRRRPGRRRRRTESWQRCSVSWRSARRCGRAIETSSASPAPEWLDDLLRDKAHGSLEYVFTLLSLIHERAPLMAAFRSLHLEDRRLRGTALEYLEGILPAKTREMLWGIFQERPLSSRSRDKGEIMQDLLKSSETILLRVREEQLPEAGRQ